MKKTGPCCHCGVTSTPLWRNGPPDKPILCNACGSRWRTKGSLTNYTPLHVHEPGKLKELKAPKVKGSCFKPKVQKLHKKRQNNTLDNEYEPQYCDQNYRKMVEGDPNRRSSCGPASSAMSYSESCAHIGTNDASDMTGSAQSNVWDPLVPSKKMAFVNRPKPSPVEMLTKELYSILQEERSCSLSECSEDDLLYESATPLDSETGYGSVLIRHPNSKSFEEESEASSLPLEKKVYANGDAYLGSASFPVNNESSRATFSNVYSDKLNKSPEEMLLGNAKRYKAPRERHGVPQDRDSPLVAANLLDESLKKRNENKLTGEQNGVEVPKLACMKRSLDRQTQIYSDMNGALRIPKRVRTLEASDTALVGTDELSTRDTDIKYTNYVDNLVEDDGNCSSPRSYFVSPQDSTSMQALQSAAGCSDQDLLLDMPSNASFPDAELLYPLWKEKIAPHGSALNSGLAEGQESRSSSSIIQANN